MYRTEMKIHFHILSIGENMLMLTLTHVNLVTKKRERKNNNGRGDLS